MKWTEIKVRVRDRDEEILINKFYELGIDQLSIDDPRDLIDIKNDIGSWELFDENIIIGDDGQVELTAYISDEEDVSELVKSLKLSLKSMDILDFKLEEIEDKDWGENWKKHYKPVEVGDRIVIKPSWEDYDNSQGRILIELDPGMAFGTGTHETTSLCLRGLESYLKPGFTVFDIGCGSGILSIAAAKLGASRVLGVDIEPLSVKTSLENIEINKVEDCVSIREGDLLDNVEGKADLVVSNILADIIISMLDDLKGHMSKNGLFISSGIINVKEESVRKSLEEKGFEILDSIHDGEWVMIIARLK